MSRVVLVGADPVLEHQARILLGDEVVALAPAASDVLVTRMIWLDRRPELLVLGPMMPTQFSLSLARSLRDLADVRALVSDDHDIRPAANSAGISEFLTTDPELEELDALFALARERVAQVRGIADVQRPGLATTPGRILVVASPKGGVGKTTVAANLAVGLAEEDPSEVVIVDLDLQFGDVASTLGISPRHSTVDALGKAAARDDFVLTTFLHEHPDGFFVLPAPESPSAADRVDPKRVGHLLRQLSARFRFVIVDTSPGLGDIALAAIEQASALVVVAAPDISSVRGLRKSLEALRELHLLPASHPIVLNGVESKIGMTPQDAEKIIGSPVDVIVPRRTAVALGGNVGIPVLLSAPRDPAARALHGLVRHLDDELTRREWRSENSSRQNRPARPVRSKRPSAAKRSVAPRSAPPSPAAARPATHKADTAREPVVPKPMPETVPTPRLSAEDRLAEKIAQKAAQKAAEKGKWIS
jgi:pilus assembly protein CpaE